MNWTDSNEAASNNVFSLLVAFTAHVGFDNNAESIVHHIGNDVEWEDVEDVDGNGHETEENEDDIGGEIDPIYRINLE